MLRCRTGLLCLIACALAHAQAPREFEAASVRHSASGAQVRTEIDPVRFTARSSSLRSLMKEAYGVDEFQLLGSNGWMNSDLYTIAASIPTPSTHDQVMEMLRNLLADRFHLKAHIETRQVRAYELVVDNGGLKLQALRDGETPPQPANSKPDELTLVAGTTIPELVKFLNLRAGTSTLGWPVVDHTRLNGRFKIWITFANHPDPGGRSGTFDSDFLSDLPLQLGLRLVPTRADFPFLAIDSAEKPSEQ